MTVIDNLQLEIEILSPADAAKVWKRQSKRAANFEQFAMFLRTKDVGSTFRIKVPAGDDNAQAAREIRHNFTEAAKERTRFVEVNGQTTEIPAPVLIRWKTNSHTEPRQVQEGKKVGTVEVTVIDSLDALIVATDTVKPRGPRVATEAVEPANAPADAKAGAKVTLPDGRTAVLSKAGKWRAPKLVQGALDAPTAAPGANGATSVAGTPGHPAQVAA